MKQRNHDAANLSTRPAARAYLPDDDTDLGRFLRTSMKVDRSSTILCAVVGTSARLTLSLAACTDHARRHGKSVADRMARGLGATVDTITLQEGFRGARLE